MFKKKYILILVALIPFHFISPAQAFDSIDPMTYNITKVVHYKSAFFELDRNVNISINPNISIVTMGPLGVMAKGKITIPLPPEAAFGDVTSSEFSFDSARLTVMRNSAGKVMLMRGLDIPIVEKLGRTQYTEKADIAIDCSGPTISGRLTVSSNRSLNWIIDIGGNKKVLGGAPAPVPSPTAAPVSAR